MKKYLIGFFMLLTATYFISGALGANMSKFSSTPSTMNVLNGGTMTYDSLSTCNVAAGAVFQYGGTAINLSTIVNLDTAELGYLNGVTAGVATASKAVVLDTGRAFDTLDLTTLKLGGTTVTATATQLNFLAGDTAGVTTASKALVAGTSKELDTLNVTNFNVSNKLFWSNSVFCSTFTTSGSEALTTVAVVGLDSTDYVFLSPMDCTTTVVSVSSVTAGEFVALTSDTTAKVTRYMAVIKP